MYIYKASICPIPKKKLGNGIHPITQLFYVTILFFYYEAFKLQ